MPTSVKERSLHSFITAASTLFLTNRKLKQIMKFSKPIQQKKKKGQQRIGKSIFAREIDPSRKRVIKPN